MMNYMLTFKKAYPGADVQYCANKEEAVNRAIDQQKTLGFIPEAIYRYNPNTDKYDKLIGTFRVQ